MAVQIVGRIVAGVGNGLMTSTVPVWLSETCKPEYRGRLVAGALAANITGLCTAQWLNFGMGYIPTQSVSWRFPLAFQCVYAIITTAMLPFLAESPRWLAQQRRRSEALAVMARLVGRPVDDPEVQSMFNAILKGLQHEYEAGRGSWKLFFTNDSLHSRRRVVLGAGTQFMQQWGGINVVNYYLPVIFEGLGLSRRLALALSGCNAINLLFSTVGAVFLVDRFGRKPLMFWGAFAQCICFVWVATGLSQDSDPWKSVAVTGVFLFFTSFGMTWIAVPWMYPAEVNTQRMRIAGAGIATATNWICNYAFVLVTPVALESVSWRYYVVYAVLNVCFIPIVKFFYVETNGRSLEQIDALFEGSVAGVEAPASHSANFITAGKADIEMVEQAPPAAK
ncbi:hexose carrier protein [Hortaea werneckii]|nr:hexose carrier protein [Hortaea werneckii]KAI7557158.1 hexose carrier protein [Hortaea werneckii]